jgi:hypothetical protein
VSGTDAAVRSGPIVGGDMGTVRRHLRAVGEVPPAREVYAALTRAALEYLPTKKKGVLKRVLAAFE